MEQINHLKKLSYTPKKKFVMQIKLQYYVTKMQ